MTPPAVHAICPHHDGHLDRLESLEDDVARHNNFHAWFEKADIAGKIERSYNLLIGLVFLHGGVVFVGVLIAIKKGLF